MKAQERALEGGFCSVAFKIAKQMDETILCNFPFTAYYRFYVYNSVKFQIFCHELHHTNLRVMEGRNGPFYRMKKQTQKKTDLPTVTNFKCHTIGIIAKVFHTPSHNQCHGLYLELNYVFFTYTQH